MKIICDSMADIPKHIIEKYDITIMPLTILVDDKEYLDGVDLTHDEFYKILRNNNTLPKTSQITYSRFKEAFEEFTTKNEDVLYIGGSSSASGTFQSATLASNDTEGNGKVYLFDTQSLSLGAGLFVIKACQLKEDGLSIDEILNELNILKGTETTAFFVDDLTHLKKGGRISSAKATVGTLLKIKPVLTVEDGLVVQHSQARGSKQVYSTMMDITLKKKIDLKNRIIIVGYCDNETGLEGLKSILNQSIDLNSENIHFVNIGAGIASHAGPSIVALATL